MMRQVNICPTQRRAVIIWFLLGMMTALMQLTVLATQSVTLTWSPNTDTNVAGYKIYYGMASRAYTSSMPAGRSSIAARSQL